MEQGNFQSSCRDLDNFTESQTHALSDSSFHSRAHPRAYGPWRSTDAPKVKGGAVLTTVALEEEAPATSTSERVSRDTASTGTSNSQALARLFTDIGGLQRNPIDEAQKQLFQVSQADLQRSCQAYADHPTKGHGQQLLSDLQRVEHLVHRQLGLQGDLPHIQANTALIAQNLTSIAANPKNLCLLPSDAGAGSAVLSPSPP